MTLPEKQQENRMIKLVCLALILVSLINLGSSARLGQRKIVSQSESVRFMIMNSACQPKFSHILLLPICFHCCSVLQDPVNVIPEVGTITDPTPEEEPLCDLVLYTAPSNSQVQEDVVDVIVEKTGMAKSEAARKMFKLKRSGTTWTIVSNIPQSEAEALEQAILNVDATVDVQVEPLWDVALNNYSPGGRSLIINAIVEHTDLTLEEAETGMSTLDETNLPWIIVSLPKAEADALEESIRVLPGAVSLDVTPRYG